ncbi:glutathione peroxidase [Paraburkholderia sp. RL18-101-BIB-B]|uniref:glutathione peroxidase n=1 Tax=unclassified Paraburkholderia TaxID=2615204 RepID=UPI0038BD2F33
MSAIRKIPLQTNAGDTADLSSYDGKVLLIVNVASKCGLTVQYEGLQTLYERKRAEGFEILAFPANNFKGQEPGTNEEIRAFCDTQYGVSFPLFAKISVVGEDQHPLYHELTQAVPDATGEGPMRQRLTERGVPANPAPGVLWNFEKFLISRDGAVLARFSPDVTADDPRLLSAIDTALAARV